MALKTKTQARAELQGLAAQASALGFQVIFSIHTETEGYAAGKTLTGITISTIAKED